MPEAEVVVTEAGARNSKADLQKLQAIHDHACAMGATCAAADPDAATESSEAARTASAGEALELKLFESATPLEAIVIREAKADYEIKLIAPGKGSSAFYPAEVLKRDGPKTFVAGTHVYLNHATAAEEAARPEGDVKNLAGVLTTNAVYHETHAKGPGLYGRMKVFADHGQMVEEKAAHVGMSIRASGMAESGTKRDGLPILKALTSAESVDVVTRAGAGGMILTESAAGAATLQETQMTTEEVQKLVEAASAKAVTDAVAAAVGPLKQRALRGDALIEAARALASVTLPEASKQRVIESVLREAIPVTAAGELDTVKFAEAVAAEAKREGAYVAGLTHAGRVTGMGVAAPVEVKETLKPEEINARSVEIFRRLGLSESAAKAAVKGRAA
jgi:hypothetical protein